MELKILMEKRFWFHSNSRGADEIKVLPISLDFPTQKQGAVTPAQHYNSMVIYNALLALQAHWYLHLSKIGEFCLFLTKIIFCIFCYIMIETQKSSSYLYMQVFLHEVPGQVKNLKQISIFSVFCYIFVDFSTSSLKTRFFQIQITSQVHVYKVPRFSNLFLLQ